MKQNQKIIRVQLSLNNPDEFLILGIVSAEPDYKVSLSINKKLGLSLKNTTPVSLTDSSGVGSSFNRFSDDSDSAGNIYFLITNRIGNNYLFRKLKNIDFIFIIHNMESAEAGGKIHSFQPSLLKEAEHITAVFNLDISIIGEKQLHHLIV